MSQNLPTRRRVLTGGLVALVLGGAGYGIYEFVDSNPPSPPDNEPRKPLRLQASWINDAEFIGYFVAIDHKYYERCGVSVEYIPGGPLVTPESSLLNGRAEIALTTPETTAQFILRDRLDFVIIGTQYQKNPIGIVSLARNPVRHPSELIGKKVAVAAVNRLTLEATLRLNRVDVNRVQIIPYEYDPRMLTSGAADATVDFVTNVPYAIRRLNEEPVAVLMYDFGLTIFNNTLVVRRRVLEERFDDLARFVAGSILGWKENYRRPVDHYPKRFASSYFQGTGRTVENEIEFNQNQRELIETPAGVFSMSNDAIRKNIDALRVLNLNLEPTAFDTRVYLRASQIAAGIEASS